MVSSSIRLRPGCCAGLRPDPMFIAFVSAGDENLRHITPSANNLVKANHSLPMQKGDARWYRPSQTRYGAHVGPHRCTILRSGKADALYNLPGQRAQLQSV